MTTTLKHPVSQTEVLCPAGFVFIPKEHKHQFLTPTFREMMDKQIKAVVARIKNDRQSHQKDRVFEGFTVGFDKMYWEIRI